MGQSIDLYSYNYEKLVNKTLEVCKTDNKKVVEDILLACGNKIGNKYIILNQELWEDSSCYYNVAIVLEHVFNTEDVFGKVFCTFDDDELEREDLISAIDKYEIYSNIGIDEPEEE